MYLHSDQWEKLPPAHAADNLICLKNRQMSAPRMLLAQCRAILAGETRGLVAAEDGMVTFITVVTVLFFTVLIALVANISYNAREKVEIQNSADAIATSAATWQARGMNAVTAANHLMGELTALCVMHYSFGGPELDDGKEVSTQEKDDQFTQLKVAQKLASGSSYSSSINSDVDRMENTKFRSGATIYDGRLQLVYVEYLAVQGHVIAFVVQYIPYVGPFLAELIDIACTILRLKVQQEWLELTGLENAMGAAKTARQALENQVLPAIQIYADTASMNTAFATERAVKDVAKKNKVNRGALFPYPSPVTLKLPVVKETQPTSKGNKPESPNEAHGISTDVAKVLRFLDAAKAARRILSGILSVLPAKAKPFDLPDADSSDPLDNKGYPGNPSRAKLPNGNWAKEQNSQFVRATYPWVNHWREPVRDFMELTLTLSVSSAWYLHWSNRYALAKPHEFRTRGTGRLAMYVMVDSEQYGKGMEPWTKASGSRYADKLFCVVGFAHRPPRTLAMPTVFGKPQQNSQGLVAFAQAMLYNANNQDLAATVGGFQPELGWNTLNWRTPVSGSGAYEFGAGVRDPSPSSALSSFVGGGNGSGPSVKLNWQAKLTPVTRLFQEPAILAALPTEHSKVLLPLQGLHEVTGTKLFMNH
jgi:hypothetical protein